MATQNIQLKDGNGNQLMPKTDAEIVDVQFNARTKTLSERLAEMKFVKKLSSDEGELTIGYINNSNVWVASTSYVGMLWDVSDYVGMCLVAQKYATNSNARVAFLQDFAPTNGQHVKYSAGTGMYNQTDDTPVIYEIPQDCKYLYILRKSESVLVSPHLTIYDQIDSLDLAHLHVKAKGEIPYKIVKSFYPKMMQAGKGYISNSGAKWGKFSTSPTYYGNFIPLSEYRGKIIRVVASTSFARIAFTTSAPTTNTTTSILCANTDIMDFAAMSSRIFVVPGDCNYLYVYQRSESNYNYNERVDILEIDYDSVISDFVKIENDKILGDDEEMNFGNTKVAKVFSHYFPNITSDDELNGLDTATITSDGITLPAGVESKITHNKLFVFDDEKITLDVTASNTDKILMYCSNSNVGNLSTSDVESYVLFNFVDGKISIYRASTISTSTGLGTELKSILFTASAGKFRLTIGRNRRNIFASIYNYSDRTEVSVMADESLYMGVNAQIRPAGWMYRYPSFMTLEGTPIYKMFCGYTKTDLYMLFQGDSYTQGYAGLYKKSWSYQSAKYFKNSRTCGISGCKLSDVIQQYHDSIKGKIDINVMVITIGINDMSDLTSDALIATWANTFKSYCDELVADGITPIVNRIWPEGSTTTATATKAKKMNDAIRALGYDGADFGAVTGYTNNTEYYTQGHLSPNGNNLSYDIFVNELSMYKQD